METLTHPRWTLEEVRELYSRPLLNLVFQAAGVHRAHHDAREVQLCTLLSIKTGGCPEDCSYCPQSAHYRTSVGAESLMETGAVLEAARKASEAGSTRFCMGAAWREIPDDAEFEQVLEMVRGVRTLGMEVCCTLGMLTQNQARRLAEAGLTAYNHNLDSSQSFYEKIVRTRTYQDRLATIRNVAGAGISLCCGGILGMGETSEDRVGLLHTLANLDPQPESVPINALVAVENTPLAGRTPLEAFDFVRTIATARVLMPKAMVRLSAGRLSLSLEAQALAFLAGANSIFTGDKLLTTPNPGKTIDDLLLSTLGLKSRSPYKNDERPAVRTP